MYGMFEKKLQYLKEQQRKEDKKKKKIYKRIQSMKLPILLKNIRFDADFKWTGCFLIPYLICLIVAGVPALVLEIGVGQYTSQGGITAWKICPLFQGKNSGIFYDNSVRFKK